MFPYSWNNTLKQRFWALHLFKQTGDAETMNTYYSSICIHCSCLPRIFIYWREFEFHTLFSTVPYEISWRRPRCELTLPFQKVAATYSLLFQNGYDDYHIITKMLVSN